MPSTYYWLGDVPAVPLVLVPARDGELIDLTLYSSATATLTKPTGAVVDSTVAIVEDQLEATLPALDVAGMSWLRITLHTADDKANRLDAVPVIVMDDTDGWHTLPSARAEWPDAVALADRRLWMLLQVAKFQVVEYAPTLAVTVPPQLPPLHWRQAQLMHARNLLNAAQVDPAGSAGGSDFTLTPFPLDWAIKQMLRPQRGFKGAR